MERQNESDLFGSSSVLKVALGVFLGGLLLWLGGELLLRYRIYQVVTAVDEVAQTWSARNAESQRQRSAAALAKRVRIEELRQSREAAASAARAEVQRKDLAWNRFFQRSDECLRTSSVECGNQYIRARREFERRYAAGDPL